MNFLAHCLLAHPGEGLVAGGVLGDFVKGSIPESFPVELRAGVRLHRRIDSFSNRLPAMKKSAARFPRPLRRVAPVLLDIVADHCLALSWPRHGIGDLKNFTARAYAAVGRYRDWIPARGSEFVRRMIETDLLARYNDPAVALRAMEHVLTRLRMRHLGPGLAEAFDDSFAALADDFDAYYPELDAFARAERPMALNWAESITSRP
ncbi:MAG: ACP phosphodiesterase [Gammaproteobacteria bacterium]|nr:ACP phosphodiesterase [Gammaproteobacteria bacterium]